MQLGGSNTQGGSDDVPAGADTEVFDAANPGAGWQAAASMNIGRAHPNTVLLPDGSMVRSAAASASAHQWPVGAKATSQVELWDPVTRPWSLGPAAAQDRSYHSTAVLLPDGRVVSAGDDVNGGTEYQRQRHDKAEIYSPPYLFKGARPTIASAPSSANWGTTFSVTTNAGDNATKAVLVAPGSATHAVDMSQRYVALERRRPATG